MEPFQKGKYPVQQVIFVGFDSVMGGLLTGMLKEKYGTVDILHNIRHSASQSDLDMLLATTRNVVTTCWDGKRTLDVLRAYEKARGWDLSSVRVYELCDRLDVRI